MPLFYVTICIPIEAVDNDFAFAAGHSMVSRECAKFAPQEVFGEVVSVEDSLKLNDGSEEANADR